MLVVEIAQTCRSGVAGNTGGVMPGISIPIANTTAKLAAMNTIIANTAIPIAASHPILKLAL